MRVALTATRIQKMWSSWAAQASARAKKPKAQGSATDEGVEERKSEPAGEEEADVAALDDGNVSDSNLEDEPEEDAMICHRASRRLRRRRC